MDGRWHSRALLAALLPITLHALVIGLFPNMPLFDGLAVPLGAYLLVRLAPPLASRQRWLLLFGALVVFQLGVFRQVWHFGEGGRHALVGGVIPWSDAGELLTDALRKMHGEDYDVRSTTRPMYPAIFGLVFYLTGQDVRLTLLVFAAIGLALVAAVTNTVWTARGPKAAAIVLGILMFFARRFFIVIGTETLGFVFGAVAFLLFWHASRPQTSDAEGARVVPDDVTIPAGVLFLSLGIVTRAGPMLAPLAVVLWVWRTVPSEARMRIVVRCVAAMVVAFAVNTTLVRTMGEGLAYADFPPILYGVLHGEDQKYVLQAHPEILALEQPASSHAIMALVASEVKTQPWLVVTGALRSMGSFVVHPDGLFSLVFYDPDDLLLEGRGTPLEVIGRFVREAGPYRVVNLIAMALLGVMFVIGTLVGAARARKGDARSKLLFYVAIAVLLSNAVTPAWTSEAVRLQAATLCFLIALATTLPAPKPLAVEDSSPTPRRFAIASTVAVLGMYVIAWSTLQARPRMRDASCRSFDRLALVPSTLVEIRSEAAGGYTPTRVRRNVLYLQKHNPELSEPIAKSSTEGMGIEVAYDACAMKNRVLLHPAETLRRLGGANVRIVEGEASKEGVIVARVLARE